MRNILLMITCAAVFAIGLAVDRRAGDAPPSQRRLEASKAPVGDRKSKKPNKDKGPSAIVRTSSQHGPNSPSSAAGGARPARNPFARLQATPHGGPSVPRPRLEHLPLSELRLVAIVKDVEGRSAASVEDRDGIGFLLREGTKIGPLGGYVKEITPKEVIVIEPASPGDPGEAAVQEHHLTLRAQQHEGVRS